ncbi:MAG: AI-2E family transporter, partial [Microbacteriaceae bacterium]
LLTDTLGRLSIRSVQIIVVLLLSSVVVFALLQVKLVVIPVLVALLIAAALSPVIAFLRKRGIPAIIATWITLVASVAVLAGIVTLIVFAVRNQWGALASSAMEGINRLKEFIDEGPIPIDEGQLNSMRDAVVGFFTSSQFSSGAIAGVSAVGEIVTGLLLLVVILFFFLKDGDRIWAFFLLPFHGDAHERGQRIGRTTVRTLGGYVRGTAIVAIVDAVAIGTGLAILRVPLALPLAVIVFLSSFVPLVGATVAGTLAALVALVANGPLSALIIIVLVIAVNQLEGDLLLPMVMAQSLKLHPLVILLALAAGTILGGIIGAVLAVPIAAVAWAIVRIWNAPEQPEVLKRPTLRRKKQAPVTEP